jgi:phosphatidylglycerol:prolipoprotein diacylglycerol transferase
MLPVLQLGPLALQLPGLLILLGIWMGLSLAEKFAIKRHFPVESLYNLVFSALTVGLVGARLGSLLQAPQAFWASPLSLFSLNPALLDPISGVAAGLAASLWYGKRNHLPGWATLDALTPLLAMGMLGLALAHIASGQAYGAVTSLPWSIELWGARRHPSQFYELAAATLILLSLGRRSQQADAAAGSLFAIFVALTAGLRLFLEAFRGDSTLLPGGIRSAQVLAWLALATALVLLHKLESSARPPEARLKGN